MSARQPSGTPVARVRQIGFVAPGKAIVIESDAGETQLPPGELDVVIETYYSVISPGTELAALLPPVRDDKSAKARFPYFPGYAAVGKVLEVGVGVSKLKPGDIIFAHTPHASHAKFDHTKTVWAQVPKSLTSEERLPLVPFARLATVGLTALVLTKARPGQLVAVVGLGLVGQLAAQCALVSGYQVIGLDPSESRRRLAEAWGLEQTFDPSSADFAGAIKAATNAKEIALCLETSGTSRGLETALTLAAVGGEVFLTGYAWRDRPNSPPAEAIQRLIFSKYLTVRSGWEWQLPKFPAQLAPPSIQESTEYVLNQMEGGRLDPSSLVTDRIRPEEAHNAYVNLAERPDRHLGVIIDWTLPR